MLFRRIRNHVVSQNWTAIAIDFVIVVLGVFVGIQVSNWNSNRLEQLRAQGYLQRIRANLENDQKGMDVAAAYWAEVIRYGESAVRYADRGELADSSQLWFEATRPRRSRTTSGRAVSNGWASRMSRSIPTAHPRSTRRRRKRYWTATWRPRASCLRCGSGSPTRRSRLNCSKACRGTLPRCCSRSMLRSAVEPSFARLAVPAWNGSDHGLRQLLRRGVRDRVAVQRRMPVPATRGGAPRVRCGSAGPCEAVPRPHRVIESGHPHAARQRPASPS